jgi:hypothetical protein
MKLTEFLLFSLELSVVTIGGTTHIKTIFSFSPGIGKHFIGNALCSSDDSVTGLIHTKVVCKFHGLTLLLRVGTLWRCGHGLFFEVPPLASDPLLTTLHPLLENVLQTIFRKLQQDSGAGSFDLLIWLETPINRMGRDLDCMADVLMWMMVVPIRTFAPCDFWAFPTISRGQNRLFHYPAEACGRRSAARFREVGGAL